MNDRTLINRLLSPAGFGLVLIFFLMPFFTVSCGVDQKSQVKTTFTGLTLVTGSQPRVEDQPPDQAAKLLAIFPNSFYPEVLVVLAALAVIAGIALGLLRAATIRHGASLSVAVLAVGLLVLEIRHTPTTPARPWSGRCIRGTASGSRSAFWCCWPRTTRRCWSRTRTGWRSRPPPIRLRPIRPRPATRVGQPDASRDDRTQ
jgi:hypothetical protein